MNNSTLNWVVTALLIPLAFGAYVYAFAIDGKAEDRAQTVKQEVQQQAQEIKKDLKEQIVQSEQRVQEALKELKELIKNGGRPTP